MTDPSKPSTLASIHLKSFDFLLLSAFVGLASGLLEVSARVVARLINPTNRLDLMTRDFPWLTPLSSLLFFSLMGSLLLVPRKASPKRAGWFAPRLLIFLTVLPALMVTSRQIYPWAWTILAAGISIRLTPVLERGLTRPRLTLAYSCLFLLSVTGILAATIRGGEWLAQRSEAKRTLPPAGAPNVILIVLDTVRADHLSLDGSDRATSPALVRLAERGIRFARARSTAPWTLASHASLFTGHWPHELGVEWTTPLEPRFRTLAETLGDRGYATAGFVANTLYCSHDTRLDRGFTHYEDYRLTGLTPLRTSWLMDHSLKLASDSGLFLKRNLPPPLASALPDSWLEPLLTMDRKKDASEVNGEFLRWLGDRPQPNRPFLAFLNYYDAHSPYILPAGERYRFGVQPQGQADFVLLAEHWTAIDRTKLSARYRALARDCYDDCIAYLDQELGRLLDDLVKRGILDHTLVIVTSDHGEGFGEHDLFDHGESLFSTELHVPLVIVPPGGVASKVVNETVSLRDVPATILDLLGPPERSQFPGRSLARYWQEPAKPDPGDPDLVFSELPTPNPSNPNQGRSPAAKGPLVSLAEGRLIYIRNQKTGLEQLFDIQDDPRELTNRAVDPRFQSQLARLSQRLDSIAGPAHKP